MNMNQQYADTNELNDFALLHDFNKKLHIKELGRTQEKCSTDASGYTKDNQYLNIELKRRFVDVNRYKTIIIEGHKYLSLLKGFVYSNKIPLYINFMNGGYVILFNLSKLSEEPTERKYKIWSELYQGFEISSRFELPLKDAWIYKKEKDKYILIQKGW